MTSVSHRRSESEHIASLTKAFAAMSSTAGSGSDVATNLTTILDVGLSPVPASVLWNATLAVRTVCTGAATIGPAALRLYQSLPQCGGDVAVVVSRLALLKALIVSAPANDIAVVVDDMSAAAAAASSSSVGRAAAIWVPTPSRADDAINVAAFDTLAAVARHPTYHMQRGLATPLMAEDLRPVSRFLRNTRDLLKRPSVGAAIGDYVAALASSGRVPHAAFWAALAPLLTPSSAGVKSSSVGSTLLWQLAPSASGAIVAWALSHGVAVGALKPPLPPARLVALCVAEGSPPDLCDGIALLLASGIAGRPLPGASTRLTLAETVAATVAACAVGDDVASRWCAVVERAGRLAGSSAACLDLALLLLAVEEPSTAQAVLECIPPDVLAAMEKAGGAGWAAQLRAQSPSPSRARNSLAVVVALVRAVPALPTAVDALCLDFAALLLQRNKDANGIRAFLTFFVARATLPTATVAARLVSAALQCGTDFALSLVADVALDPETPTTLRQQLVDALAPLAQKASLGQLPYRAHVATFRAVSAVTRRAWVSAALAAAPPSVTSVAVLREALACCDVEDVGVDAATAEAALAAVAGDARQHAATRAMAMHALTQVMPRATRTLDAALTAAAGVMREAARLPASQVLRLGESGCNSERCWHVNEESPTAMTAAAMTLCSAAFRSSSRYRAAMAALFDVLYPSTTTAAVPTAARLVALRCLATMLLPPRAAWVGDGDFTALLGRQLSGKGPIAFPALERISATEEELRRGCRAAFATCVAAYATTLAARPDDGVQLMRTLDVLDCACAMRDATAQVAKLHEGAKLLPFILSHATALVATAWGDPWVAPASSVAVVALETIRVACDCGRLDGDTRALLNAAVRQVLHQLGGESSFGRRPVGSRAAWLMDPIAAAHAAHIASYAAEVGLEVDSSAIRCILGSVMHGVDAFHHVKDVVVLHTTSEAVLNGRGEVAALMHQCGLPAASVGSMLQACELDPAIALTSASGFRQQLSAAWASQAHAPGSLEGLLRLASHEADQGRLRSIVASAELALRQRLTRDPRAMGPTVAMLRTMLTARSRRLGGDLSDATSETAVALDYRDDDDGGMNTRGNGGKSATAQQHLEECDWGTREAIILASRQLFDHPDAAGVCAIASAVCSYASADGGALRASVMTAIAAMLQNGVAWPADVIFAIGNALRDLLQTTLPASLRLKLRAAICGFASRASAEDTQAHRLVALALRTKSLPPVDGLLCAACALRCSFAGRVPALVLDALRPIAPSVWTAAAGTLAVEAAQLVADVSRGSIAEWQLWGDSAAGLCEAWRVAHLSGSTSPEWIGACLMQQAWVCTSVSVSPRYRWLGLPLMAAASTPAADVAAVLQRVVTRAVAVPAALALDLMCTYSGTLKAELGDQALAAMAVAILAIEPSDEATRHVITVMDAVGVASRHLGDLGHKPKSWVSYLTPTASADASTEAHFAAQELAAACETPIRYPRIRPALCRLLAALDADTLDVSSADRVVEALHAPEAAALAIPVAVAFAHGAPSLHGPLTRIVLRLVRTLVDPGRVPLASEVEACGCLAAIASLCEAGVPAETLRGAVTFIAANHGAAMRAAVTRLPPSTVDAIRRIAGMPAASSAAPAPAPQPTKLRINLAAFA